MCVGCERDMRKGMMYLVMCVNEWGAGEHEALSKTETDDEKRRSDENGGHLRVIRFKATLPTNRLCVLLSMNYSFVLYFFIIHNPVILFVVFY